MLIISENLDENLNQCIPSSDTYAELLIDRKSEDCRYSYTVKTGYRKVPGNMCAGGVYLGEI